MPAGTCADIAAANGGFLSVTVEKALPGGGFFGFDCRYTPDGVSQRDVGIGCDGPIDTIRVYNTGSVPGYARLPNKRRGNKWLEVPPGANTTITQQTTGSSSFNSLGLETYADVAGVGLSTTPSG
jgi:hypothetical protein